MDLCLGLIVQYILLMSKYRAREASEEKKYVAPYKLPVSDRFALTFLVLPCF